MSKIEDKIVKTMTFMAQLITETNLKEEIAKVDIARLKEMVDELNKEDEPKPSLLTGKEVILFYKSSVDTGIENPTVTILGEIEGFGLYVEFEGGHKEVVAFTELSGLGELNE